jgi:hypothetical protein
VREFSQTGYQEFRVFDLAEYILLRLGLHPLHPTKPDAQSLRRFVWILDDVFLVINWLLKLMLVPLRAGVKTCSRKAVTSSPGSRKHDVDWTDEAEVRLENQKENVDYELSLRRFSSQNVGAENERLYYIICRPVVRTKALESLHRRIWRSILLSSVRLASKAGLWSIRCWPILLSRRRSLSAELREIRRSLLRLYCRRGVLRL